MGEQSSLEFDLTFGDVLLHKQAFVITSTQNHQIIHLFLLNMSCLHSSKGGSGHLFFPNLKSPLLSSRCYYQNFAFDVINTGN